MIAVETIAVEAIAVEMITVEAIALCADPGGGQSTIAVEMIAVQAIVSFVKISILPLTPSKILLRMNVLHFKVHIYYMTCVLILSLNCNATHFLNSSN